MLSAIGVSPARKIKNKKELKEMIRLEPEKVMLQDSSMFTPLNGGDYTPATELPIGKTFYLVLPSEYERKYFGSIKRTEKGIQVK